MLACLLGLTLNSISRSAQFLFMIVRYGILTGKTKAHDVSQTCGE